MQIFCQTGFYSCPNTGWISCCSNLLLAVLYVIAMIYTFPFIFSTHCLMKVWMHHRYDLSDLFSPSSFFFFSFFFKSLPFPHEPCLHSRLSTVSVNTDTCFCHHSFFFIFAFPSAGNALCLECRRVIARQPKVTLIKTKGSFCQLCNPVLSTLLSQQWHDFLFFSFFLEAACTDSHADFVIGYRLASWAVHTLTISLSWSGIFSDQGPGT